MVCNSHAVATLLPSLIKKKTLFYRKRDSHLAAVPRLSEEADGTVLQIMLSFLEGGELGDVNDWKLVCVLSVKLEFCLVPAAVPDLAFI